MPVNINYLHVRHDIVLPISDTAITIIIIHPSQDQNMPGGDSNFP